MSSNIVTQVSRQAKWQTHPWYKKLFNHRYKLALFPLLGLVVPSSEHKLETRPPIEVSAQTPPNEVRSQQLSKKLYILTTINMACLLALVDFLLSNQKRISVHELGHLLAHQVAQSPQKLESIEAYGFYGGALKSSPEQEPSKGDLREICSLLIEFQGGNSIERLLYGYNRPLSTSQDRLIINLASPAFAIALLLSKPKQFFGFLDFWLHLDKITQRLLQQIDPQVVEKLADRLCEDRKWDADRIQELVKEFGLDKFPPFEESVEEVRKILEPPDGVI